MEVDYRSYMRELRERFRDVWSFGRNVLVGWMPTDEGLDVVYAPIYALPDVAKRHRGLLERHRHIDSPEGLEELLGAGCRRERIELPFRMMISPEAIRDIDSALIDFSVTHSECRAVILFDIVKFSILSPIEQVAHLNSLAYSINIARSRCEEAGFEIDIAMTTTGDGFYVWNRQEGLTADLALYHLTMMTLADNAIARERDSSFQTPVLRTCIHFGSHYEYYQAVGSAAQARDFIVGDVTIEAARMVGGALPGQVLVGSYLRKPRDAGDAGADTGNGPGNGPGNGTGNGAGRQKALNTPGFVALAQHDLPKFAGIRIDDGEIDRIEGYLTGERMSENEYSIRKYAITDKHGMTHKVFNAKFNIHTNKDKTIYVGLSDSGLASFDGKHLKIEDIYLRVV